MSPFSTVSAPVYSTDFENVTKRDAYHLMMGIENEFVFGGDGGASMWMEGLDGRTQGLICHSGSRCVGLEVTNISKSQRCQFEVTHPENLVGNELFVSVWMYLPADWRLHTPDNWYELVNPFFTEAPSYLPYGAVHILQPDITRDIFTLSFDMRDVSGNLVTLKLIPNYALPRGRWFNLQYYVYRDATNGILRIWIDGALLLDANKIQTKNPSVAGWFTTVGKIYYDTSDTFSPYRLWVDDLAIYNTQSALGTPPAIPGFPWESTLMGVIVGLWALAVLRRRRNLFVTPPFRGLKFGSIDAGRWCLHQHTSTAQGHNALHK